MKKRWLPLLALFLLLAGCTGSCGTHEVTGTGGAEESAPPPASQSPAPSALPVETERPVPTSTPTPSAAPSADPEPGPTESAQPEPETPGPTDEEVLEAYRAAKEAYGWFEIAPMSFDPEDSREEEGAVYYRVDYPGIDSLSSLRGYLKTLFSDALVEKLLPYDSTQYVDIDGELYVQDGGRGSNIYLGAEYTQVLRDDNPNRVVVQATVETVDPEQGGAVTGNATYHFPYEKVGDQWIFTDFSLLS